MFKILENLLDEARFWYHDWRRKSACKIYYVLNSKYSGEKIIKAYQRKEHHIKRLKDLAKKLEGYDEADIEEFEQLVRDSQSKK